MNRFRNAFSVLELDVADDKIDTNMLSAARKNQTPDQSAKDEAKDDSLAEEDTNMLTSDQSAEDEAKDDSLAEEDTNMLNAATKTQTPDQSAKDEAKDDNLAEEDTNMLSAAGQNQTPDQSAKDEAKYDNLAEEYTNMLSAAGQNQTPDQSAKDKAKDDSLAKEDKSKSGSRLEVDSTEFKLPLVWIDLEMTGLNVEVDRILEIACIITDGNLTKFIQGPEFVINQTKECLDNMGEWCQEHHGNSGLTQKVLFSTITEAEAEKQVLDFVKMHVGTYTPNLAGNSVYTDYLFLKKYMPHLASLFTHVLVDVSSVKALCNRWFPIESRNAPRKTNKHRAMDDIMESITELLYFKNNIFK